MHNRCQLHNSESARATTPTSFSANTARERSGNRSGDARAANVKIKLRLRMFRFWRSGGEPPAFEPTDPTMPTSIRITQQAHQAERNASTSPNPISIDSNTTTNTNTATRSPSPNQNHPIHIPFHNNSNLSLLTHESNGSVANHLGETNGLGGSSVLAGTKLWQSLVLPMVLACVIFLVALWARQISLALTNDAIVMMLIMVCIFVVMSAVAFWLSCDHFFKGEAAHAETSASRTQSPTGDEHFLQHHSMCPHHHLHSQHHQSTSNTQQQLEQHHHCPLAGRSQSEKCCHIAVIDCQPPDYQSALLHSVPIHQYLMFGQHESDEANAHSHQHHLQNQQQQQFATLHVVNFDGDSILSSGNEEDHSERHAARKDSPEAGEKQLYLFPPSYDELSKK